MTGGQDAERRELMAELERLHSRVDSAVLSAALTPLAQVRITVQQLRVLSFVGAAELGSTSSALAGVMGVSQATMSGLVDRLQGQGLVERAADESDHRIRRISSTEAGQALIERLAASSTDVAAQAAERMPVEDLRALVQGLRAVARAALLSVEADPQVSIQGAELGT